jgi:hypothetical protein
MKVSFIEVMKEAKAETKKEMEKTETQTIAFSSVSESDLCNYLRSINMCVFEEDPLPDPPVDGIEFKPFDWQLQKEKDTPRAKDHFETELKKFGVNFGKGLFKLYDMHKFPNLLDLEDVKTGKLSGGTDLIIAPHGLHEISVPRNSCVAVELKTHNAVVEAKGLDSFLGQAIMELIATNYHSEQMTLVVLTDLCSSTQLLTFTMEYNALAILQYKNVSLAQMAIFINKHLEENCFKQRTYNLKNIDKSSQADVKESVIIQTEFKRKRVSNIGASLNWEHFKEMLEDAPLGSVDRAMVIKEHFRSLGLPESKYLSFFV